jgi:hypothetical protein
MPEFVVEKSLIFPLFPPLSPLFLNLKLNSFPVTPDLNLKEYIQNPTQRHNCQISVNPTHPGKPARGSANPTYFAASETVFRKSDTIPENPTHRSAIVAWQ